jgi:acetolactate synthase-1/2/3 large subunit
MERYMTGAEYIAAFLHQRGIDKIFLITGGACAFIVDAIARNKDLKYYCFHHEQAAAMAADTSWRVQRKVGATVVTSGPGATNLITGIACSFFDSIPTLHIAGQVNQSEKLNYRGAAVRQAGFQETKIVEMVRPITKYAVQVTNAEELKRELIKAYNEAITGRMGPVLIDVPMDVQKAEMGSVVEYQQPAATTPSLDAIEKARAGLAAFFRGCERPLVLFGAGVGLAGAEKDVANWLTREGLPFVSSWNALTNFDHDHPGYCGHIGVYGNRGANFLVQNCDRLLVLGSRLDNRQRSGDTKGFAPCAEIHVLDIDQEELKKYQNNDRYSVTRIDLAGFGRLAAGLEVGASSPDWQKFCREMKQRYFGKWPSASAQKYGTLSPYAAIQRINGLIGEDACVVADDGANLCWAFQSFHRRRHDLFTAGGNSPMGYSFPASIGAALYQPERQVVCFTGDGSMQMNIQELQTLRYHNLNIKLFILNNYGYGIIKQFQDLYFESRYEATGKGYSQPDFGKVAEAYGIPFRRVERVEEITADIFATPDPMVIDLVLHPNTMIEPKLEMGHSIEDQYPYMPNDEYERGIRFARADGIKVGRAPAVDAVEDV